MRERLLHRLFGQRILPAHGASESSFASTHNWLPCATSARLLKADIGLPRAWQCPLSGQKEDIANICVMSVRFSKSGKRTILR